MSEDQDESVDGDEPRATTHLPALWGKPVVINDLEMSSDEFESAIGELLHSERSMLAQEIYERIVNKRVMAKVRELVAFAHEHDYFRYGDGEGGALGYLLDKEIQRYLPPRQPSPPRQKKPTASHRKLHRLAERDGGWTCHYCADPIGCPCSPDAAPAVADHVIPLGRGGPNTDENQVLACVPCNSSKGDRTPSEWGGRQLGEVDQ